MSTPIMDKPTKNWSTTTMAAAAAVIKATEVSMNQDMICPLKVMNLPPLTTTITFTRTIGDDRALDLCWDAIPYPIGPLLAEAAVKKKKMMMKKKRPWKILVI
eukprot:scaffold28428_cov137-Skeletonema_menzelii.AAC.2